MKKIFRIAEISYGYSQWDCSYAFEYADKKFEVQRVGTDYSADSVRKFIKKMGQDVDAIALVSLPPTPILGNKSYVHREYFEIMNTPSSVPLCDGTGIREILNLETLIQKIKIKEIEPADGFFFPSAMMNTEIEEYLRHIPMARVGLGDLYSVLGFPLSVRPFPGLMALSKVGINISSMVNIQKRAKSFLQHKNEYSREILRRQILNFRYVVADLSLISFLGENADIVRDKDVIILSHHPDLENCLQKFQPRAIINLFPEKYNFSKYINHSVLEAVLRLTHGKTAGLSFEEWQEFLEVPNEMMPIVRQYSMRRKDSLQMKVSKNLYKLKVAIQDEKEPDFAFVVHALSHKDFERLPVVGPILGSLPQKWNNQIDHMIGHLPPISYGRIRHIISESSKKEVNGIIYALFSTPQVLKTQDPEVTYMQIQKCCEDAAARGAKIIGLGAYTKVVGDSGVTISKNSPLPVTTGNSLSASSTLWGLYEVVKKMNLVKIDPNLNMVDATAMVIGATGSIGKVSAKLLALVFKKLVIVAPKMERLQELKIELQTISSKCEVICTVDANEFVGEVDALVTATSAFDQKIVDVMQLQPGCVVCDCSRPLDFTVEDALKRPDVIIMESGELILPGPYEMTCDLGLPGKAVYACLAETALLALEGRHESFTLGRDIDFQKVKEIYKLSRKHGLKLAHIQGHMGVISDREIELTRELALSRRESMKKLGRA